MWAVKYFAYLWAAVAVYAVSSLLMGGSGFAAYNDMREKRALQLENIAALKSINEGLELEKNALLYDRDSLSVYARELGFGADGERFIRIAGLPGEERPEVNTGLVYRPEASARIDDTTLRIFAIGLALTLFFGMALWDIRRQKQ